MSITIDDVDLDRDSRLVQQCQAGRAEAFDELYRIYRHRIVRLCARRLGNQANAEDVAQEAFIRAWGAIDRLDGRRRFYPWLHVIASNACTDVLRRDRPTTSLSEFGGEAELDDADGVEEMFARSIDASVVTKAMRLLNERHRRVLYLREELEWSVQDIAAYEGLEPNAIDSVLWRARAALRRKFQRLSEGVAAVFATGATGFLSARHRLARVAHGLHQSERVSLPARAAVVAAMIIGAGASSAPLLSSPPANQQPSLARSATADAVVSHHSTVVTPHHPGSSVAPSTHVLAGSEPTAFAGPPADGQSQPSAVPAGSASSTGLPPPAVPQPDSNPLDDLPGAGIPPLNVLPAAASAAQTTVTAVTGAAAGVVATADGVVQDTVDSPVLAPIHQPPPVGGTGGVTKVTLP